MDLVESVAFSFELATDRGLLLLADRAQDCHLAALLRRLLPRLPGLVVCLTPSDLSALSDGAVAVYRLSPEHCPTLNRLRPMFAERRLRVLLWSSEATTRGLLRDAPDFFDWISRREEVPDAPPPFAVASVKLAASAARGIVWHGPGSLDRILLSAGESPGETLTLGDDLAPLVDALRAAPEDRWVQVEGVANDEGLFDLRFAMQTAGREGRVAVLTTDFLPTARSRDVGWASLDDHETPLPALHASICAFAPEAPAMLAASLASEGHAVALVKSLHAHGVDLDEILRVALGAEDPPAALATHLAEVTGRWPGLESPPWSRARWRKGRRVKGFHGFDLKMTSSRRVARFQTRAIDASASPARALSRGDLSFLGDLFEQSAHDYRVGLALHGGDERTHLRLRAGLARTLTTLGRYDEALEVTQGASALERSALQLEHLRALVRAGRIAEARAVAEALEQGEHSTAAWSSSEMEFDLRIGRLDRAWMNPLLTDAAPGELWLSFVLDVERMLGRGKTEEALQRADDGSVYTLPGSLADGRLDVLRALACVRLGRFAVAEEALSRALSTLTSLLGAHHCVGQALTVRAELRARQGRHREAAAVLTEALAIYAAVLDVDHPDRLSAEFALASLPDRRDPERARQLVAWLEQRLGPEHFTVRRLIAELANATAR